MDAITKEPEPTLAESVPAVHASAVVDSRTLGPLLRKGVYRRLPASFYALLQVAAPLSYQMWHAGWYRTAGWLGAASAFGIWALAQQRLEGHDDQLDERPVQGRARVVWRFTRGVAGLIGGGAALALLFEGFVQILARVFNCPGCAG